MRIGFFGGTFDPPHRGHLAVARATATAFSLDRVLLVPTARQPLKQQAPAASYADRLAMTELLCEAGPQLEASPLEAPSSEATNAPNYTVDTLQHLRSAQPEAQLYVIVGIDAFLDIHRWREPETLLTLADWIVVARPGFPLDRLDDMGLSPAQRSRVHVLPDVHEPVSATEIRRRLHAGEDCYGLTTKAVLAYIREHRLYI